MRGVTKKIFSFILNSLCYSSVHYVGLSPAVVLWSLRQFYILEIYINDLIETCFLNSFLPLLIVFPRSSTYSLNPYVHAGERGLISSAFLLLVADMVEFCQQPNSGPVYMQCRPGDETMFWGVYLKITKRSGFQDG